MLCHGKGLQTSVEESANVCHVGGMVKSDELEVVQPNSGHFGEPHETEFKGIGGCCESGPTDTADGAVCVVIAGGVAGCQLCHEVQ
jgi:hypothetical protein